MSFFKIPDIGLDCGTRNFEMCIAGKEELVEFEVPPSKEEIVQAQDEAELGNPVPQKKRTSFEMPSTVAFHTDNYGVTRAVAVGWEAFRMQGRCPEGVEIRRPIVEGCAVDQPSLYAIVHHMVYPYVPEIFVDSKIKRLLTEKKRAPTIATAVPENTHDVHHQAIKSVFNKAEVANNPDELTDMVSKPVLVSQAAAAAIAIMADAPKSQQRLSTCNILDIGGGTANIGIHYRDEGVRDGYHSVPIGGDVLDLAIRDYVRVEHKVLISLRTAEWIKVTIGSAQPTSQINKRATYKVWGKKIGSEEKAFAKLSNREICGCLQDPLEKLIAGVMQRINSIRSEQTHADINRNGWWLTGNTSKLEHLDRLFSEKTNMKFRQVRHHDPGLSVILGVKLMLADKQLLDKCDLSKRARYARVS